MKTIELSKEWAEDFVVRKVKERLSIIVWGENCESLKDALIFPYEWFLGEITDKKLRKKMERYLFGQGFKLKKNRINNKRRYAWEFPTNSGNEKFSNLFNEFNAVLDKVVRDFNITAGRLITKFIESSDSVITENVQNTIYKLVLSDRISLYNRGCLIMNRKNNRLDNYGLIYFHESLNGDVIFLSKNKEYHGFDQTIEEMYVSVLNSVLNSFFVSINGYLRDDKSEVKPNKFVIYISSSYFNGIKNVLEPLGFDMSFMPKYLEEEYICVGTKVSGQVPMFIEICELIYVLFTPELSWLKRLYEELYNYYQ